MSPDVRSIKTTITKLMSGRDYRPLIFRDLIKAVRLPRRHSQLLRRVVRDMESRGEIVRLSGRRYALPDRRRRLRGVVQGGLHGYGFVMPEEGDGDIFVRSGNLGGAVHGDRVEVEILGQRRRRHHEGKVVQVLERGRHRYPGTIHVRQPLSRVFIDEKVPIGPVSITPSNLGGAENGQKVIVEIDDWGDGYRPPGGKVVEVLGYPGDPGLDILLVAREYELPLDFPLEVIKEVDRLTPAFDEERVDLTGRTIFTIDPADARDFDDAISLHVNEAGRRVVGVHIADVSAYVSADSLIDREARQRGVSVYLPDRVLPMLPEKLSEDWCSLKAGEPRRCLSVDMELSPSGEVVANRIYSSRIQSRARLSYAEAQSIFDGSGEDRDGLRPTLVSMMEAAADLRNKRTAAGSLDFDLPESRAHFGPDGKVVDIRPEERLDSNRLIEEFMLAANRTIALHLLREKIPFIRRIHDRPDIEKVEQMAGTLELFGFQVEVPVDITPGFLQNLLSLFEIRPDSHILNTLLLRAMKRAEYSTRRLGHFALAFKTYTHFTSPIRRYPDLVIHRLLRAETLLSQREKEELKDRLDETAALVTEREQVAESAERTALELKKIEFMQDRIGDVFTGFITGVINRGVFVQIDHYLCDGLIPLSTIEDDYYLATKDGLCVRGRRTRKSICLGDRVEVQLVRADKVMRHLDFQLIKRFGKNEKY